MQLKNSELHKLLFGEITVSSSLPAGENENLIPQSYLAYEKQSVRE